MKGYVKDTQKIKTKHIEVNRHSTFLSTRLCGEVLQAHGRDPCSDSSGSCCPAVPSRDREGVSEDSPGVPEVVGASAVDG